MERKNTPAPWRVVNGSDVFTDLGANNADGVAAEWNDGWHIADCSVSELSYSEINANAKLIAAAPALLEALEEITNAFIHLYGGGDHGMTTTYAKAIAAIKQARGKQ